MIAFDGYWELQSNIERMRANYTNGVHARPNISNGVDARPNVGPVRIVFPLFH